MHAVSDTGQPPPPALEAPESSFRWVDGERLIRFGAGALAEAPALLAERGFEGYALLTTERTVGTAPALADRAAAVVHVPEGGVPEAAAAVRPEVGGRPLAALGGGRVVDAAKAIAAADGLPVAAVPTTLSGAPITRIHRLPAGVSGARLVRPSLVVAAPELMASRPLPGLAATAMNALAHAAESLYVPFAHPVAELAALRAAELIAGALRAPGDPAQAPLALGAVLGAYAVGATGIAVHHVVCQTLVRTTGTPHAETNAVMLPRTLGLVASRAPAPIGRLAAALGAGEADPAAVEPVAAKLAAAAGATRLSDLGVEANALPGVAAAAARRPEMGNTPDPPDEAELRALLERAL